MLDCKFWSVLFKPRQSFPGSASGSSGPRPRSADEFIWNGIVAGHFTLADLKKTDPITGDALISLEDVCDANEIIGVIAEKERLAYKKAQSKGPRRMK